MDAQALETTAAARRQPTGGARTRRRRAVGAEARGGHRHSGAVRAGDIPRACAGMVRAGRRSRRSPAAAGGRRGRGGAASAHGGHRTVGDGTVGAGRGLGLRRPGALRTG
eukprot:3238208-Pleurochrysis_carterae.AAC.1